jgi:GNAT superfamily N-acetyltransferase
MERHSDTSTVCIVEWQAHHARWRELLAAVATLGQSDWATASAPFHRSSYLLVAEQAGELTGFLRLVIQEIGPELDRPPVKFGDEVLTEAKILAFGVLPEFRGRGIGRMLQEAAIARASEVGCYQVRSHSSGTNAVNHRLKLSLGFGVHPIIRGADTTGVYFILPLRGPTS